MKKITLILITGLLLDCAVLQAQQQDTSRTQTSKSKQQKDRTQSPAGPKQKPSGNSDADQSTQNDVNNQPQQSDRYRNDKATQSDRNEYDQMPTDDMVVMEVEQYPASLRETLKVPKYKGWENGKVYHNPATGEYLLTIEGTGKDIKPRSYRFDKNGQPIDPRAGTGYDNKDQ
jgi:hypothetical protein